MVGVFCLFVLGLVVCLDGSVSECKTVELSKTSEFQVYIGHHTTEQE